MKDRPFSQEERRQREKEERSRQKKQEQAYREAQRGVYSRIYEEQNAMPEDYRQAFWDDPRDRLYDRDRGAPRPPQEVEDVWDEEDWEQTARRQVQEDLWDDPWPKSAGVRRREEPPSPEDDFPEEDRPRPRPSRREVEEDDWQPIVTRRGDDPPPPPPPQGGERPPKKGRRKRILVIVLVVLLALAAAAVVIHQLYVRPPDIPVQEEESAGTDPGILGAGRREDVYTFLLVGRDDGGGGNTDTIMVGCYDVKNATLDVLSIYRDTLVDVPWEIKKINSVYNNRGIEGLQEQVKNLIGFTPDYYFVVELDAVEELVDAIGGVDYNVPYNMDYDDPSQDLHIHFQAGEQHLNGEDAVRVLRWRKNNSGENLSVGDVGRVEVQHTFLEALAKEMLSLGTITKIGDIVDIMNRNLESNLNYGEMIWFGERFLLSGDTQVRFHNLPGDYTGTLWSPTYQNYQSYVFVNSSALRELVNTYLNPYLEDITPDMQHVIYDTTVNNLPVETGGEGTTEETASGGTTE